MKKVLSLLTVALMSATALAGHALSKKIVAPTDNCRFRANEWQVDLSVVGASGVHEGETDQWLGGDLGVNYFWSKYFGVGIDNSVGAEKEGESTPVGFDTLQANLFARYPICGWNLAPYAMVGGGSHWSNHVQGNGSIGAGLEYRVSCTVGFFADCRWLYGSNENLPYSIAMPRIGVRLAF